jgi:hypothetical protein
VSKLRLGGNFRAGVIKAQDSYRHHLKSCPSQQLHERGRSRLHCRALLGRPDEASGPTWISRDRSVPPFALEHLAYGKRTSRR